MDRRGSTGSIDSQPGAVSPGRTGGQAGTQTFDTWHDKLSGMINIRRGSAMWGSGYQWKPLSTTPSAPASPSTSPPSSRSSSPVRGANDGKGRTFDERYVVL